jgi:hypothetical protein
MLRRVIKSEYVGACRYTGYVARSIRLTLACGHEQVRKASAGIPMKAKCPECARGDPLPLIKQVREALDREITAMTNVIKSLEEGIKEKRATRFKVPPEWTRRLNKLRRERTQLADMMQRMKAQAREARP